MHKRFNMFMMFTAIILAFGAGFLSFQFLNRHQNNTISNVSHKPITLKAEYIMPQNSVLTHKYIGYITPVHEVDIKPYIAGFIEKVYVKGGQFVKKDDILLILKQDEYIAALHQADADILKSKAVLQNADSYFSRLKKAGKSVSASELEAAKSQYLSALASLEQSKANYTLAEVNYNYTVIRAPISGVVGDISLTKGNYISPASGTLFKIVQYNPVRVVFSVSDKQYLEELAKKIPFGDEKLFLQLPNGQIFPHEGTFRYTDNSINKSTSSMAVYADFKNIGKILTPNTFVTVLSKNTLQNTISVPKNAVVLENKGNFIYLIRGGILKKEPVDILGVVGETFILKNTFQKDDAVVTESVDQQNVGMPAEVRINRENA